MISERIKTIATFINSNDTVVDIGCDHGYLGIYLKQNNLCKEILSSDINEYALNNAINNYKKYHLKMKTFLSDGFNNIDEYFDTAVIAGMGTHTILNIIKSKKCPNKLIISSNNDLPLLRTNLNKLNFMIKEEKVVLEKNHYYVIMLCLRGIQKLKKREILFGISNDKKYYEYLYKKNKELIKKVPFLKKIKLIYNNILLKSLTEKK